MRNRIPTKLVLTDASADVSLTSCKKAQISVSFIHHVRILVETNDLLVGCSHSLQLALTKLGLECVPLPSSWSACWLNSAS